jgi:hypothetical protein
MAVDAARIASLEELSATERQAVAEAAAWYAKYHERMISERADDRSAAAVAQRERYLDLHSGLRKLGIRLRMPDGL